jgi:catalase
MSVQPPSPQVVQELLDGLDQLFGLHPGFRAVHAKGVVASGVFTPSAGASRLTKVPHANRPSTNVLVRFSDFAGVPNVPDNDPNGSGPRGMGVRFYLGEHVHTDIVAHSADGFPVSNAEEFLGFVRSLAATKPDSPKPTPIESFLATHPSAQRFVEIPKPIPTSFARESFFSVAAYRFTNAEGVGRFGRYRLRPAEGNEYLSPEEAAKRSENFLVDEFARRLGAGRVTFQVVVQLARDGDEVNSSTAVWEGEREEIDFGTITLRDVADQNDPEVRKIILDPIPRVDGIAPSDDPLLEVRAAIYLLSGRRRRAASK